MAQDIYVWELFALVKTHADEVEFSQKNSDELSPATSHDSRMLLRPKLGNRSRNR